MDNTSESVSCYENCQPAKNKPFKAVLFIGLAKFNVEFESEQAAFNFRTLLKNNEVDGMVM